MRATKRTIAFILSILIVTSLCSPGYCKSRDKSKSGKSKKISAVKNIKKQVVHKAKKQATTAPSQLYVFSSHKEADIYIDEDFFGKAPVNIKNAKPGRHLVEAYAGQDLLFRQYVTVVEGIPSVIEINGKKQVSDEEKDYIIL